MSNRVRLESAKYKTTNWKHYSGALMIWLDYDLQWSGLVSGKRGSTQSFLDVAIQFCLTIKDLSLGAAPSHRMGRESAQDCGVAVAGTRRQHVVEYRRQW